MSASLQRLVSCTGLLLAGAAWAAAPAGRTVVLDRLPLLFADDSGIAQREGVVRTLHAARTRPAPVLEADRPWEGERVYVYGSVVFDPALGRYVMWYLARPGLERHGSLAGTGDIAGLRHHGFDVVLYATSADA